MDDISQRIGISKKTLYQFYENKADLVQKIMEFTVEENRDIISKSIHKNKNAIEELMVLYRCTTQIVKQLNPSLDFELRKYYPESFTILDNFRNEFIYSLIVNNLDKGIKDKLFREDMDIRVIARIYTTAALEVFNTEVFPSDQYAPPMIIKELLIYHIRGIATKKGLDYLENKLVMNL